MVGVGRIGSQHGGYAAVLQFLGGVFILLVVLFVEETLCLDARFCHFVIMVIGVSLFFSINDLNSSFLF